MSQSHTGKHANSYAGGMRIFTKTDPHRPHAIKCEALGLKWLAEAMPHGGAPVVPVLDYQPGIMTLVEIPNGRPTRHAAYQFGQTLAVTHAAGAPSFGCPPPGWEGDGVIGRMELPLRQTSEETLNRTWGEFFAEDRILPCLPVARNNRSLSADDVSIIEEVCKRLADGHWDAPQPGLVHGPVARIHGDLWSGNVLWARREDIPWTNPLPDNVTDPIVGVLIDPAAQGGHSETDLAFLEVFGQSFLEDIYAGYNSVSPLADGWEERRCVHQLYLLALHAAIFGGSYGPETMFTARQCLRL